MDKRRIKISKIENKILRVSCEISIVKSLSDILYDCLCDGDNLKSADKMNLALVLSQRLNYLQNRFNKIELILKI
ncbi:MAG: hypothetical protein PHX18_00860 [Candidatus Gastranaerophilales bacterium]|nr:hypothetical protein [Candidatus Gastranaerophilales bacterium]